jgi:RNA polymerase sigma-70 factor (ECF subfamily)
VERFRAGAEEACFAELYRRLRRRVFGVALAVLDDVAAAEEVCHDAFLRAYDRFASLQGVEFSAWVCRIATNLALNAVRRRGVSHRVEAALPQPPASPGAERRLISREAAEIAAEIIAGLKPEQRRVFLLRHLDGKSHPEIGAATGYSAREVRSHLQNARRNFSLLWRERTGEEVEGHG